MKFKLLLLIFIAGGVLFVFSWYQHRFPKFLPGPKPQSGDIVISNVYVDSLQVLQTDNPVQVTLIASGTIPDPCQQLDEIKSFRQDNTLTYIITAVKPHDANCTTTENKFEQEIPIDLRGLKAGTYTVTVNDVSRTFNLLTDQPATPSASPQ